MFRKLLFDGGMAAAEYNKYKKGEKSGFKIFIN